MHLNAWLEEERGRATAMADHFGVNKTAVFGWKVNGVPPDRMKAVRQFTAGAVTLDDMVPEAQCAEEAPAVETAKAA